jgi:hypothetical protein
MIELLDRLGPRAVRRMTPRVGVVLAGAGALIAIGGAAGLGGDQLVGDDGDVQRVPGIVVAVVLIAAGYATLARTRTGALASAGATAATLGVPILLFFLTFDADGFPPFSVDAVLGVSSVAWLAAYLLGPGSGRVLFAGAALAGAWLFTLNLLEPIERLTPFGFTPSYSSVSESVTMSSDGEIIGESSYDDPFSPPELTTIGGLSLAFGIAYAAAAFALSRRGYDGTATAFIAVGIAALFVGVQSLVPDLEQVGTGLLAVALGLGLAIIGSASNRRATAWIGAGGVGVGTIVLVQDAVNGQSTSSQSGTFLLAGLAVVFAGHLIGVALGEPAEEDQRRSLRRAEPTPDAPEAGHEPGLRTDDSMWQPPTSS